MMPDDAPAFPSASFADHAVDLFLEARDKASTVAQLEIFAARYPGPVAERVLHDARASAERTAGLYRFVKAMVPHEAAIRAAIGEFDAAPAEGRAA